MMRRISQPLSLDDVRDWYEAMRESLLAHRSTIIAALSGAIVVPNNRFIGMTIDEVDKEFAFQREELDNVTVLSMMASAEAKLQSDYDDRLDAKRKDPLTKAYRNLHLRLKFKGWFIRKIRPQFDNHILETIKDSGIAPPHVVGNFRDALNLRHWLAHGRYWGVNLGRTTYSPDDIYRTIDAMLATLPP